MIPLHRVIGLGQAAKGDTRVSGRVHADVESPTSRTTLGMEKQLRQSLDCLSTLGRTTYVAGRVPRFLSGLRPGGLLAARLLAARLQPEGHTRYASNTSRTSSAYRWRIAAHLVDLAAIGSSSDRVASEVTVTLLGKDKVLTPIEERPICVDSYSRGNVRHVVRRRHLNEVFAQQEG